MVILYCYLFVEAAEGLIGNLYCIGEGVRLLFLLLFFDDDNAANGNHRGAADDNLLELRPSLLGMSHGNSFLEAAEDTLCS